MLLQRLRLHKGVWMLLVFAVLIKVASATVCSLDGPSPVLMPDAQANTPHVVMAPEIPGNLLADADCMLGEPGDCHCSCAHTSTLPAAGLLVASNLLLSSVDIHPPAAPSLRMPVSPLRPPIA